jgi:hypothetical protein
MLTTRNRIATACEFGYGVIELGEPEAAAAAAAMLRATTVQVLAV